MSAPLQWPLIALVPNGNFRLGLQDSLARHAFARNKVRSITKVRVREKPDPIDSLEYTELDRRGNKILTYNPAFRARTVRHYDAHNRLIEILQQPHPSSPYPIREVMDPFSVPSTGQKYCYTNDAPTYEDRFFPWPPTHGFVFR